MCALGSWLVLCDGFVTFTVQDVVELESNCPSPGNDV